MALRAASIQTVRGGATAGAGVKVRPTGRGAVTCEWRCWRGVAAAMIVGRGGDTTAAAGVNVRPTGRGEVTRDRRRRSGAARRDETTVPRGGVTAASSVRLASATCGPGPETTEPVLPRVFFTAATCTAT